MYGYRNNIGALISIAHIPPSDTEALKSALTDLNSSTKQYGLVLTVKNINKLAIAVKNALLESDRVEVGEGILPVLAGEFCSSVFVNSENYASVLEELVYVFFQIKTATCDRVKDRDLVRFLKDFYENKCMGDIEKLKDRDIDSLVRYIELELGE